MNTEIVCPHCSIPNPATEPFCENCGAALSAGTIQSTPSPTPAQLLLNQRYLVIEEVGSGGFGTVYKVQDMHQPNNCVRAVKNLDLGKVAPNDLQITINSFMREALMLSSLTHPNLPRIYEHFLENNSYYLVMDFIEGETLEKRLAKLGRRRLNIAELVKIGIELATVLDYLHTCEQPIIFRDLKPSNIMFTPTGQIYLIDFGIARHFKPGQKKDTTAFGTDGYAPLEQYGKAQTTPQSDIYSLGAVLHQLLSGDVPAFPPQFASLKLTGAPQASLSKLVMQMLERDPQNRPASAADVKQQLQQILQDLQRPTVSSQARSQPTTRSAPPTRILPTPSAPPQPPIQLPRGALLHTCTHHSGAIYALAWSPDGKYVASAGEDCQVCVWEALTGKAVFTYQQKHTSSVRALAWSPDSRYVASASNDRTVQIWQAKDGQAFSTYLEHRRWVQALSWSLDAKLIASGDASGQIHLWNPRTGQRQSTYRQHHASIHALSFSPDGKLLASGDEDSSIHVWDSVSLVLRSTYMGHQDTISALAWSPDGKNIASSSEDRKDHSLHIWQATTGARVATYAPHQRVVNAIAWSPSGQHLASASRDQTVQLLDAQTGDSLFTYRGHISSVNALAWSPDGNYLASATSDDMIHVWWAK